MARRVGGRAGAVQDASRILGINVLRMASWSAAALRRFSQSRIQLCQYCHNCPWNMPLLFTTPKLNEGGTELGNVLGWISTKMSPLTGLGLFSARCTASRSSNRCDFFWTKILPGAKSKTVNHERPVLSNRIPPFGFG
jgi:hypothetical protein